MKVSLKYAMVFFTFCYFYFLNIRCENPQKSFANFYLHIISNKLIIFLFYNYKINIYDVTSRTKKLITSKFFGSLFISVFKTTVGTIMVLITGPNLPIQLGTDYWFGLVITKNRKIVKTQDWLGIDWSTMKTENQDRSTGFWTFLLRCQNDPKVIVVRAIKIHIKLRNIGLDSSYTWCNSKK